MSEEEKIEQEVANGPGAFEAESGAPDSAEGGDAPKSAPVPKQKGPRVPLPSSLQSIVGALLFLIFVPRWVWTSALGIVLISVGYLLWRFGE